MFELRPILMTVQGLIAAVCLSLLAGCSAEGGVDASAADSSTSSTSSTSSSASSASSAASSVAQSSSSQAAAPPVPTGIVATAGNAQVSLTWSTSSGATSYKVKRSTTNGGSYAQVGNPTSTSFTDTSLVNGTTYYYVITAANAAGESANSTQVSASPAAQMAIPGAPASVAATPGDAQVSLTWAASSGATGYRVKRSTTNGGPYSQLAAPTTASYTDNTANNGTTYYYVVSAFNTAGESANSTQVSAQPTAAAPPPTTFGTWINVTPSSVNLISNLSCGNYGTETVQADPANPSNLYVQFNCQGIWKSTDYGATWTGPINTGTNGTTVGDCAGGITISPTSTASVPTIYAACIRGAGTGFWKSTNGGVSWTRYTVAPSGSSRQDYYPPVVDPYDQNHLLMAGHEMNYLVESVDGGQTWTNVSTASGMSQNGGTGSIFFINTGNASTTRGTWLWMAQQAGGSVGTWRTANGGSSWVQVDRNEHPHGASQIYQPDNNGVVFMAGAYSDKGWGVLRSTDYGQTWAHVGNNSNETVVVGTSKNLYAAFGYPVGPGGTIAPTLQVASQPGTGTWTTPGTPSGMTQGPAQIAVVSDGTHNILVGAMWNAGMWRYIEP